MMLLLQFLIQHEVFGSFLVLLNSQWCWDLRNVL